MTCSDLDDNIRAALDALFRQLQALPKCPERDQAILRMRETGMWALDALRRHGEEQQ